jgi:ribosomal protein L22
MSPAPKKPAEAEPEEEPKVEETTAEEPMVDETPKPKRAPRAKKAEAEKPAETKEPAPAPTQSTSSTGTGKRDRRRKAEAGVTVRAHARYVRTSARKARLVCDHIRGKDVAEARAILAFTPRAAAKPWLKLLESAVANAEHNHELVGEELRIVSVHADEGPTLKRFRPRAMGRATRIRKRTSHLTIELTPKES